MKFNAGVTCKVNEYNVTAVAMVDGKPSVYEFKTATRDARAARKSVADSLGIKASQVVVSFDLVKRSFTIDADVETLTAALDAAGITYEFASDSNADNE